MMHRCIVEATNSEYGVLPLISRFRGFELLERRYTEHVPCDVLTKARRLVAAHFGWLMEDEVEDADV